MGTDLTYDPVTALSVAELPATKASCAALVSKQSLTSAEVGHLRAVTEDASFPATEEWVRGRIATLLSHYYIADKPEELDTALAGDWIEAMMASPYGPLPEWALQRACVRWLSGPNARRRPVPGDILALAAEEMHWLYVAKSRLFLADNPSARVWHPLARSWEPEEPKGPFIPREKLKAMLKGLADSLAVAS